MRNPSKVAEPRSRKRNKVPSNLDERKRDYAVEAALNLMLRAVFADDARLCLLCLCLCQHGLPKATRSAERTSY